MDSQKYHANFYEELGDIRNDFRNYNITNLIVSKIKGKSVLDIGCGNGYLLGVLNKKGIKTFGIEPNKELIRLAKLIHPKLHIFQGFVEEIGKVKNKVDTITMIDVLEHIKDDDTQIKKIYKHINERGQLIIIVPAFQFLYGKRDKNNGHHRRYSKKTLTQKLSKSGFKIKYVRYWNMLGFFPYLFYERILNKELNTELRTESKKGIFKSSINMLLNFWFKFIENNINFGFGLSLICIAEKV